MEYTQRHLAELINHLTTEPRCFVSDEGRAFIEADGSLRAPNRKSLWPPLIFATGIALFGAFLFMNNTDVDMSGLVFGVTAIGGFAGVLLGGIAFWAWLMTAQVERDATHVVDGRVERLKYLRKVGVWEVRVAYTSPKTGESATTKVVVPPQQKDLVAPGTSVAVLYATAHDDGHVL